MTEESVDLYIEISEGIDGKGIITELQKWLQKGSSVLELGMGEGKDLVLLSRHFKVTGSDFSPIFLDRFKKDHPDFSLENIDARNIRSLVRFDCIYSNKVLHHLNPDELRGSLKSQAEILNSSGIICHSFWAGEGQAEEKGLIFSHYRKQDLESMVQEYFHVLHCENYMEFGKDDSILLIAQKLD